MGTGKSGRYLNSKGSGRSVSDFALVHSSEGTFTYNPKNHKVSSLKSGGHVASLKKNRHAPNGTPVFGTYKGVRVGIIKTKGKVSTVFPDSNQYPVIKKGKKK